jgi:hypothetical protein
VAVSATQVAKPRYEEKGLLIEGARTNSLLRSEEFDNASWSKSNCTITANQSKAPDGSQSMDKLIPNNGFVLSGCSVLQAFTKSASPFTYTFSVYAKSAELDSCVLYAHGTTTANRFQARFNLNTGVISEALDAGDFTAINSNMELIADGIYRCSITFTSNADVNLTSRVYTFDSTLTVGNGTSGMFVWGAQTEGLEFPSSYIRTEGSIVTRALDVCGQNLYSTSKEITILTENSYLISPVYAFANRAVMSFRNSGGSERFLSYNAGGVPSRMFVQGAASSATLNGVAVTDDSLVKIVSSMTATSGTSYQDGEFVGTVAINSFPSNLIFLHIGGNSANGRPLYGHIKRIQIYELALTSSEAKAL